MNIFEALLLLCLLIVISAFVSCSELALASARKIKLQVMAKDGGDTRALDVLNMQQQPGSFITVVQIGLNAVAILAGIVGEAAVPVGPARQPSNCTDPKILKALEEVLKLY